MLVRSVNSLFLIIIFFLTCLLLFAWSDAGLAQSTETQSSLLDASQNDLDDSAEISVLPEALSRLLARKKEDQRFEELRDLRVRLLASVPGLRAKLQVYLDKLEENQRQQTETRRKIADARSGVKSPEMTKLEEDLVNIQMWVADTKTSVDRNKQRVEEAGTAQKAAQQKLAVFDQKFEELDAQVDRKQQELSAARESRDLIKAKYDEQWAQKQSALNSAKSALEDFRERLSREGGTISPEQSKQLAALQADVRAANAELALVDNAWPPAEFIPAENRVAFLQTALNNLQDEKNALTAEKKRFEVQASEKEEEFKSLRDDYHAALDQQSRDRTDLESVEQKILVQKNRDAAGPNGPEALKQTMARLADEETQLENAIATAETELQKANSSLNDVENEINTLLIPRTAENAFKREISYTFAWLVGLVILLFFLLALKDEKMRQVVFSAEAGIQFVTLFSLVIAIILFGITGILEGKELSALLGGISGYILGRSSSPASTPTQA